MSSSFDFKIKIDNTKAIEQDVAKACEAALKQCGEVIEGHAKNDCPVDTGLLRNSITYGLSGQPMNQPSYNDNAGQQHGEYKGNAPTTHKDAVYVGSNVEYAPHVEFKSMSHRVGKAHFLRDAGTNHINELKNTAETVLHAKLS